MTATIHKSPDARRHRRSRFKRALKPLQELFGCTQMECADRVSGILGVERKLKKQIEALEVALMSSKDDVVRLQNELKQAKAA